MPKNSSGAADATRAAELPAGRELDALVAERVMGWKSVAVVPMYGLDGGDITDTDCKLVVEGEELRGRPPVPRFAWQMEYRVPDYSTDIAAAWRVVEKMRELGFAMTLDNERRVFVCFANFGTDYQTGESGESESAPEAISRAALRAVGNAAGSAADSATTPTADSGEAEE